MGCWGAPSHIGGELGPPPRGRAGAPAPCSAAAAREVAAGARPCGGAGEALGARLEVAAPAAVSASPPSPITTISITSFPVPNTAIITATATSVTIATTIALTTITLTTLTTTLATLPTTRPAL